MIFLTGMMPEISGIPMDPWEILGGAGYLNSQQLTTEYSAPVVLSIFNLLRTIGLVGIIVTLIITLIKFTVGNANVPADSKAMFTKKLVLAFFIFTAAYFFGWALALIANL